MLTRIPLFVLGLGSLLYVCSTAPAHTPHQELTVFTDDSPAATAQDNGEEPQKKSDGDKGTEKKDGDKRGFKGPGGKGGFKGFPGGKGDYFKKKDEKSDAKSPPFGAKLDRETIKSKYEFYKKLYEESQKQEAASKYEARIDRLIQELQALREEIRGNKK